MGGVTGEIFFNFIVYKILYKGCVLRKCDVMGRSSFLYVLIQMICV